MIRKHLKIVKASDGCTAVLFLNSNKTEKNIRRRVKEIRALCREADVELKQEAIVNKGPDRDIDREAVNMLISLLLTGQYDTVVVNGLAALTDDASDLQEFLKDAGAIGVGLFGLSSMQRHRYTGKGEIPECFSDIWDGGAGCR